MQSKPKIVGSCNCDDLRPVQCHLETKELWDKFNDLGTEMIITKTGRWVGKRLLKPSKQPEINSRECVLKHLSQPYNNLIDCTRL